MSDHAAKHLAAYSAALATLAVPGAANAAVTNLSGLPLTLAAITVTSVNPSNTAYFNVTASATLSLNAFQTANNGYFQGAYRAYRQFSARVQSFGGFSYVNTIASGLPISGPALTAGPGYAGLSTLIASTNPSAPVDLGALGVPPAGSAILGFVTTTNRAGWLRVAWDPTNGGTYDDDNLDGIIRIVEGAIGMPGEAVNAGESAAEVPLPATLPLAGLGVLALGAAGLRRRRRAKAAG